jgi:predicted dehydrogenase
MQSRRKFIGNVATGLAGTIAGSNVLGANDRIRFGVIGIGARGTELLREALACPNTECAGVADVYKARLEAARILVPSAKAYVDYHLLLEDPTLDAVLIATPHHLHADQFVAALDAGKHVYQERTMAFTVEHAKRMRAAYHHSGNRIVQIGHQTCSSGQVADAAAFLKPEFMGKITAIRAHFYRNTPRGKPQWTRPVYPDMTPDNIAWESFLGEAPRREFDADRYINWRLFQDYSGGNVTENLCQQLAFWYKLLALKIPAAVTMTGGLYLWKDGREVPDTMHVSMEHSEEILFSWDSGFGNNQLGVAEDVLGTDGTVSRSQQIRYTPQKVNRPDASEMIGSSRTEPRAHVQNFFHALRAAEPLNCPFDIGFRVSVACRMAVESFLQQRTVCWDAAREEIV